MEIQILILNTAAITSARVKSARVSGRGEGRQIAWVMADEIIKLVRINSRAVNYRVRTPV